MKTIYRKAGKVLLIISASSLIGCAGFAPVEVPQGSLFQQTKAPLTYNTPFKIGSKVGNSSASYLNYPLFLLNYPLFPIPLISLNAGDASIKSAAESAGITQIEHVDYEKTSILNLFTQITIYVYGD